MAFKGAISFNGVDVTLGHDMFGGECDGVDCEFLSDPPSPKTDLNVLVNGYNMVAAGDSFGLHYKDGPDCLGLTEECSDDHPITIPNSICSTVVFVNGMGAALPGITFNCNLDYETEIVGGAANVLIYV